MSKKKLYKGIKWLNKFSFYVLFLTCGIWLINKWLAYFFVQVFFEKNNEFVRLFLTFKPINKIWKPIKTFVQFFFSLITFIKKIKFKKYDHSTLFMYALFAIFNAYSSLYISLKQFLVYLFTFKNTSGFKNRANLTIVWYKVIKPLSIITFLTK